MSVFEAYARYYDLLYPDKDYAGEAEYVHRLIKKHAPGARTILELGSGTGKHAILLAEKGYEIAGVDQSAEMVQQAADRASKANATNVSFSVGDIRDVRLGRKFDVVISLFHVVSYLTNNQDLSATFATAPAHLKPGGVFIFDCWYGPAVLTQKPEVRVKRLENEEISVVRIAEPVMHVNDNTVDVNYTVFVQDKKTKTWDVVREKHVMRYLFAPEVSILLTSAGFSLKQMEEWMTGREADAASWGVVFVGKKMA